MQSAGHGSLNTIDHKKTGEEGKDGIRSRYSSLGGLCVLYAT
jgi:hypothetical protein